MGEVYRARDTKLDRDVAIKVLPAAFTADAERLARFEREAKLLASLNHSNIAHVYGFESATLDDASSVHFLAMELVEGEDLSERLKRGGIPVGEAFAIAKQIAEALEEAHEHGIVHRDLKPANIKLTPDGKVKVLDFGLAKAYSRDGGEGSKPELSHSPTMTRQGTEAGMILGTAAYMSPEQARGKSVDKRADIWAFGVVLFEMLTGRRLFAGETASDTLAAVLTRDPDWSTLPPAAPASLRRLLRRCLDREPRNRLRDIGDARFILSRLELGERDETQLARAEGGTGNAIPAWRRALPWGLAAVLAITVAWSRLPPSPDSATAPVRVVPLDLGAEPILLRLGASAVLSPDGKRLAWVSGARDQGRISVRSLDGLQVRTLAGTEGSFDPVFSPDGQEIAYFAQGSLQKISFQGGAPTRLAETGDPRGLAWADAGFLVFNRDVSAGLFKVPAAGGNAERLTTPDAATGERSHRWPVVLPGSRRAIFLAQRFGQAYDEATLEMLDIQSGARTVLHRGGSYPRLGPGGELLFVRDRGLWGVRLAADALRVIGEPQRLIDEVAYAVWSGGAQFDVAREGTLVYSLGASDEAVRMAWAAPGRSEQQLLVAEPGFYYTPRLSPDGRRVAYHVYTGGRSDLWIVETTTGNRRRLTFGGRDTEPVWSPDGQWLAYSAMTERSVPNLFRIRVDGAGTPEALTTSVNQQLAPSWSRQNVLVFTEIRPETRDDLYLLRLDEPGAKPEPYLATRARERHAVFSPDGRWVAYESDESGAFEVYVRALGGAGGRWQISENGGQLPRWAPDGNSVVFSVGQKLVRRALRREGEALLPGRSEVALDTKIERMVESGFDVGPDGRLLVLPEASEGRPRAQTILIEGWGRALAQKLGRR
jgi:serine/threonine-protein kinase